MLFEGLIDYCSQKNKIKLKLLNQNNFKLKNILPPSQKALYNKNLLYINKIDSKKTIQITNIDHLLELTSIISSFPIISDNIHSFDSITQKNILKLQSLKYLHISNNCDINNINHLKKLKKLECRDASQIKQNSIRKLTNIVRLNCSNNNKIVSLSVMNKLKILICCDKSIDQEAINKIKKLTFIDCGYNTKINNLNHLVDLKYVMCCGYYSGINTIGVNKLFKVKRLFCNFNHGLVDIHHMTNLIELSCNYSSVNQNSINHLNKLKILQCIQNNNIKNISNLKNLEILYYWRNNLDFNINDFPKLKFIRMRGERNLIMIPILFLCFLMVFFYYFLI